MSPDQPSPTEITGAAALSLREVALGREIVDPRELMTSLTSTKERTPLTNADKDQIASAMGEVANTVLLGKAEMGSMPTRLKLAYQLALLEGGSENEDFTKFELRNPQGAADVLLAAAVINSDPASKALKDAYAAALGNKLSYRAGRTAG